MNQDYWLRSFIDELEYFPLNKSEFLIGLGSHEIGEFLLCPAFFWGRHVRQGNFLPVAGDLVCFVWDHDNPASSKYRPK